jgi:hypothetical protein
MFTSIVEGFVAISAIGSMNLLAGLLRAPEAAAQVSEDGQDWLGHSAINDEQGSTGQQQRQKPNKLLPTF